MANGYVNFKADYAALQARMRAEGQMKKIVNLDASHGHSHDHPHSDINVKDHEVDAPGAPHGDLMPSDEPPEGWDAFMQIHIKHDAKCQLCGHMAPEVRPFGPNYESICEKCADADPVTSDLRWRELNPNG